MKSHFKWIGTLVVMMLMLCFVNTTSAQTQDITHRVPIFKQVYERANGDVQIAENTFAQKITATNSNLQEWQAVMDYYNNPDIISSLQERQAAQRMYDRITFMIERKL